MCINVQWTAKSSMSLKTAASWYAGGWSDDRWKQDADIEITESQVSREQAMIYYENGNWYIKDGGKEKPSGSGTWLFLDKKYEIKSDIVFMVGSSSIKLDYILSKKLDKADDKKEIKKTENKENKGIKGRTITI
mgnify:CR=1 FL=1